MQMGRAVLALTLAAPTGLLSQPSFAKSPQRTTPPRSRSSVRNCTSFELGVSSAAISVEQGTRVSRAPLHHAESARTPGCVGRENDRLSHSRTLCGVGEFVRRSVFMTGFPFVRSEHFFQPCAKTLMAIRACELAGHAPRSLAQCFGLEQLRERSAQRPRGRLARAHEATRACALDHRHG